VPDISVLTGKITKKIQFSPKRIQIIPRSFSFLLLSSHHTTPLCARNKGDILDCFHTLPLLQKIIQNVPILRLPAVASQDRTCYSLARFNL